MDERPLTFPPKTQTQRKQRDIAVAWITTQEDGRQFLGANVTAEIHRALRDAGYRTTQEAVSYAMIALEKAGYAAREVIGRRVTVFMVDPDVKVPEPAFIAARRARAADLNGSTRGPVPSSTRRPPVPPSPRPLWLQTLADGIAAWWREDPDGANAWADDVARSIGVRL